MASLGQPAPINDWIYQKPGATIDTPATLQAAQHLEQWIKAGYFAPDVNAVDYAQMVSRFTAGQGGRVATGHRSDVRRNGRCRAATRRHGMANEAIPPPPVPVAPRLS